MSCTRLLEVLAPDPLDVSLVLSEVRVTRLVVAACTRSASPPGLGLAVLLAQASLACASPKALVGGNSPATGPVQGIVIEDSLHGTRYELPPVEGGWQTAHQGAAAEIGAGVQVELAGFPLANPATGNSCRDFARARLLHGGETAVSDEQLSEAPVASWSFTRERSGASVRSRWAFYARGADCLLIEVTAPAEDPFGERVFEMAKKSLQLGPMSHERQRELDLLAGMGFLERREPQAALDRFEALTAREPGDAKAHFGALMAAFDVGPTAYARALLHGQVVLKAERELPSEQRQIALRAMGVIQLAQNQLAGAASTLSELVVRTPELAEGQYNLACALARLGDADGAFSHLVTAVHLDPSLATHARDDEDLVSLRGRPAFEELLIAADAR